MRQGRGTSYVCWLLHVFFGYAAGTSLEDKLVGNKSRVSMRKSTRCDDGMKDNIFLTIFGFVIFIQIPESRTRVIGGFNAIEGRHPYGHVSLFKKIEKHQCGGTVVASDLILTAAHCEDFFDTIRIGEYDKTQATTRNSNEPIIQTFSAVEKIPHPLFEPTFFRSDVMLVKLDARIEGIEPVRLNANHDIPDTLSLLTLIGWGTTNNPVDKENRNFPDVLQQALIPYVPNKVCEEFEHNGNQLYIGEIFDEMMCAGRASVDACRGDSGSPLILENVFKQDLQVGLVSWGRGCGTYPGVYTRISKVFPWIREQICWHAQEPPAYLGCQPHERFSASPSVTPDDGSNSKDPMIASELESGFDGVIENTPRKGSIDGFVENPPADSSWSLAQATSATWRSKRVGCSWVFWLICLILVLGLIGIDLAC